MILPCLCHLKFFLWYTTIVYNSILFLRCLLVPTYHTSYRDTALAILSEKDGLTALNRNKIPNPLHLLVKEMPGKVHVRGFRLGFC